MMTRSLAQRICAENRWDFDQLFRWQFLLTKEPDAPSTAWDSKLFGSFWLHHCPDLWRTELVGPAGESLGFLLGLAVDANGRLLPQGQHVLQGAAGADVEGWIEGLAGRFIAFIARADGLHVYADPTGGLSAMYSKEFQCVTSNVTLALDRPIAPPGQLDAREVEQGSNRFFMGETADRSFTQMMANHKLCLHSFTEERHWLPAGADHPYQPGDEVPLGIDTAERLRDITAALTKHFNCTLPISAGKDSRLILGGLLTHLDQLGSTYTIGTNRLTFMDCRVGRSIAWRYGLPHQAIVKNTPGFARGLPDEDLATLRAKSAVRTSYVWNGRDDDNLRGLMLAPASDVTLRGGLCEVARANKYRNPMPDDLHDRDYAFASLLEMPLEDAPDALGTDRLAGIRARYEAWADGIPAELQTRLIDLAHCELWMPGIVNPGYYAFTDSFYLNPFNDRRLLENTIHVPPLTRKKRRLINAILDDCDPELKSIPYLHEYIRLIDDARAKDVKPLVL